VLFISQANEACLSVTHFENTVKWDYYFALNLLFSTINYLKNFLRLSVLLQLLVTTKTLSIKCYHDHHAWCKVLDHPLYSMGWSGNKFAYLRSRLGLFNLPGMCECLYMSLTLESFGARWMNHVIPIESRSKDGVSKSDFAILILLLPKTSFIIQSSTLILKISMKNCSVSPSSCLLDKSNISKERKGRANQKGRF